MTKSGYTKLTFILSLIAAALALSAALVTYFTTGAVKLTLIAAGIFILAFGYGAWSRNAPEK